MYVLYLKLHVTILKI